MSDQIVEVELKKLLDNATVPLSIEDIRVTWNIGNQADLAKVDEALNRMSTRKSIFKYTSSTPHTWATWDNKKKFDGTADSPDEAQRKAYVKENVLRILGIATVPVTTEEVLSFWGQPGITQSEVNSALWSLNGNKKIFKYTTEKPLKWSTWEVRNSQKSSPAAPPAAPITRQTPPAAAGQQTPTEREILVTRIQDRIATFTPDQLKLVLEYIQG